jgi:hypothetical protein
LVRLVSCQGIAQLGAKEIEFMDTMDIIVGRAGDSITGKVLDKQFTIQSPLGPITLAARDIQWVHFKNPPMVPSDEIWFNMSDRVSGVIEGDHVSFKPATGGKTLSIPYASIHTVIVNQSLNLGMPRPWGCGARAAGAGPPNDRELAGPERCSIKTDSTG